MTNVSLSIEARRAARIAANASRNNLPVEIVDGNAEPTERGHSWYYETRGGTRIDHPSAYSRFGWSNMVYVGSTRRVEVGFEWLVARGLVATETPAIAA